MSAARDVYLSFFMFTTNLQPGNPGYAKVIIQHMSELRKLGYSGFDMPIFPNDMEDHRAEVESYLGLKRALDRAGLDDMGFTTNVAATRTFDPTSPYREQREAALAYLKSRVDITAALGGTIMAGPIVFPYNVFPATDMGVPVWSDALQAWAEPRYRRARPVLNELGEYAEDRNVRLGIEPVDHWETPAPNMVGDVLAFLDGVPSRQVGACVDSAHVVLGSSGPAAFKKEIIALAESGRLNRAVPSQRATAVNLGPLQDLPGFWEGTGFNLIARPDFSGGSPDGFFLELNLLRETIEFTTIGSPVFNREALQEEAAEGHELTRITRLITSTAQAGGIGNIPFIVGNADALSLESVFAIETVLSPAGRSTCSCSTRRPRCSTSAA